MNPRLSFWKNKKRAFFGESLWGFGLIWRNKEGWVHYPLKWHGFRRSFLKTWHHYKHARKYAN